MVYFDGFFNKLGHFAGFSLRMYHLHRWISAVVMMIDDTGTHIVIFRGFFIYLYYSPEGGLKLRWASRGWDGGVGGGHCKF